MVDEITLGKLTLKLPYADILPALSDDEYTALRTDIITRGIVLPIVLDDDGNVLDGHHRLRIAAELGLSKFPTSIRRNLNATEREALALDLNLHRRHLSKAQLKKVILYRRQKGQSTRQIAEAVGVSQSTVQNVISTEQICSVEMPAVIKGKDGKKRPAKRPQQPKRARVNTENIKDTARVLALLPEIVNLPEVADMGDVKKAVQEVNRQEKLAEIAKGTTTLEANDQTYPVIYADPPWRYDFAATDNRAIENNYPTMAIDDICALPVGDVAAPDCALFLWATSPKLPEALRVIEAWGFTYKTCMVWVKDKIGTGYYARQRHELLLIATRGDIPAPAEADRPDFVIEAPRLAHSAKPPRFYEVIEQMYPTLAKLEMFSRSPRDGWQAWGNQAEGVSTNVDRND